MPLVSVAREPWEPEGLGVESGRLAYFLQLRAAPLPHLDHEHPLAVPLAACGPAQGHSASSELLRVCLDQDSWETCSA